MANKDDIKTESSNSSSISNMSKRSGDVSERTNDVEKISDDSSNRELKGLQNSLVNTIATIQKNFFKKRKSLETWHQFLLDNVLYNKDHTHMNEAFCFIERKILLKREQV